MSTLLLAAVVVKSDSGTCSDWLRQYAAFGVCHFQVFARVLECDQYQANKIVWKRVGFVGLAALAHAAVLHWEVQALLVEETVRRGSSFVVVI